MFSRKKTLSTTTTNYTRKNIIYPKTERVGDATPDIIGKMARKNPRSPRRDYRDVQHQITSELYREKAIKMAKLAAGLWEFEQIYKQLKDKNDKKNLREMMDTWAESERPNFTLLESNIRFWREKAAMSGGKSKKKKKKKITRNKNKNTNSNKTRRNYSRKK
jgi:hypothetical protein